jgi:hypothetical protein
MDGIVKAMRRGGWSGRGVISDIQHGQLLETQIGPRAFHSRDAAVEWLRRIAQERQVELSLLIATPAAGRD